MKGLPGEKKNSFEKKASCRKKKKRPGGERGYKGGWRRGEKKTSARREGIGRKGDFEDSGPPGKKKGSKKESGGKRKSRR